MELQALKSSIEMVLKYIRLLVFIQISGMEKEQMGKSFQVEHITM